MYDSALIDRVVAERHEDAVREVALRHRLGVRQLKWRLRDNTGRWEDTPEYQDYHATLDRYVAEAAQSGEVPMGE